MLGLSKEETKRLIDLQREYNKRQSEILDKMEEDSVCDVCKKTYAECCCSCDCDVCKRQEEKYRYAKSQDTNKDS